ncbi:MAG: exodeoxyribonuclease VII small subunit [Bacteroidales bacterium]|nr:exodeoxyribonuclease VII small subunit [Bacteroidales bacterium]
MSVKLKLPIFTTTINIIIHKNTHKAMSDKYYSDEILGSYDKSFAELEKIEQELENPEISVDRLAELADRSLPLIRSCKKKLLEAQENVDKILIEAESSEQK